MQSGMSLRSLKPLPKSPAYVISASGLTHQSTTGKSERSRRKGQKRFYFCHCFWSLQDFEKQLAVHSQYSNDFPTRPLHWLSPNECIVQYVLQTYIFYHIFSINFRQISAEIAAALSTFSSKVPAPLCRPLSVAVRIAIKGVLFT